MKKLFLLSVSVLLSANLLTARTDEQQRDPIMTRSFPASSITEVEASTSGGSITVNGDAGSEAVVEIYASRDKWSEERIRQALEENYTIDVKVDGGKLYAEAKPKKIPNFNWDKYGISVSFKISVPRQVNSNLRTSGGGISIGNLIGSQDFKTSGGSLRIENVSGNIVGRTSGGGVTVTNSYDNIDLATSGGGVSAHDCRGNIKLRTSGGGISMSNLDGDIDASTGGGGVSANNIKGTLKTETSGGGITLNGISGNVEAKTSGGGITAEILSASEFVKLSNSGGTINLTLPADKGYNLNVKAENLKTSDLKDFRGDMDNKSLKGTVGNGGANINVSSSQRVNLSFK